MRDGCVAPQFFYPRNTILYVIFFLRYSQLHTDLETINFELKIFQSPEKKLDKVWLSKKQDFTELYFRKNFLNPRKSLMT